MRILSFAVYPYQVCGPGLLDRERKLARWQRG